MVVAAGVETQEYTYLSSRAQGADPPAPSKCRRARTGDGRDLAPVVQDGGRACASRRAPGRCRGAAAGAAASVRAARRPARSRRLFRGGGARNPLPITLYLNPGPGANVSIPATIALAKLTSVQLIKESSRDLARVSRLIVEIDRAGHARYFTTMQMCSRRCSWAAPARPCRRPAAEIARHVIDAFVAEGLRACCRVAAAVRAVPGALDASRPRARR